MKNVKTLFFSGIAMFLFSILFFSCSQDQLEPKTVLDFQVDAEYQKKITVTDKTGSSSITLGISSNNLEAFNLRTKEVFTLNTLTIEDLIALEAEQNNQVVASIENFPSVKEADEYAVHVEILDKKMGKNVVALDLVTNIPTGKASGWKSGWNWHYSWAARHYIKITNYNNVDIGAGFQYIANQGCCWPSGWNWGLFEDFYAVGVDNNNNGIDVRVLVAANGSYHYVVL